MIFGKYIRKILGSSYIKNTSTLFSGNALGQIIRISLYPIIARLYLPNNFGTFSIFLTITGILTTLANAEYYNAIVLPKDDKDAIALVQLNIIINTFLFFLTSTFLFFREPIALLLGEPILSKYLLFIPIIVWLSAIWKSIQFWFIRTKKYFSISLYSVSNISINAGFKTFFGLINILNWGLIWSSILAPISAFIILIIKDPYKFKHFYLLKWNWKDIHKVAVRYINFPKFALPTSFINILSVSIPTLLFTPVFGAYQVGLFAMAISLTLTPINTFCGSLYQVTYQKFSNLYHSKKALLPYYKKFIKHYLFLAIPGFILIYYITPWLTTVLLGNEWIQTAIYVQYLLPWLFLIGIVKVMSFIPDIFYLQKYEMFVEIIYLIIRFSTVNIGIFYQNIQLAIILFSIGNAIIMIGQIIWYYQLLKNNDSKIKLNKK